MSREQIGIAESVRTVDGETIATVRLGAPTDADVEHARRRMNDAWLTLQALGAFRHGAEVDGLDEEEWRAGCDFDAARAAYVSVKRARGGL